MKSLLLLPVICFSLSAKEYVSYNVGLAHSFVRLASERLPHIIKALEKQDSDLYCLQEAWTPDDRDQIITALSSKYPYAFFVEPVEKKASKASICGVGELFGSKGFGRCMARNCISKGGDQLTECVLKTCKKSMMNLISSNQQCALGLMANVGGNPLGAIISVFNPFKKAPLFAYGGGNGLLILSKTAFAKTKNYDFGDFSTLNRRGTLYAETEGMGVYCSHFTANLGGTGFYGGDFISWENENKIQIEKLISIALKEKEPYMLMGDFNCSIAKGKINDDFGGNCQRFIDSGFRASSQVISNCTFCESNTLIDVPADFLLDHIWSKGVIPQKTDLIFKEKVMLEDISFSQNLSDHFGIRVIL